MIEFNLILQAAQKPVTSDCFWKLFLGTVVMLAFGYAGETGLLEAWVGFFFGMVGWGYTVFFMLQAQTVSNHWKTSLHVGYLVTLVAAVHYMYLREYWVQVHKSPIVYRYVYWSITVPLQMIVFNLILKAAQKPVTSDCFWRLFLGTVGERNAGEGQ